MFFLIYYLFFIKWIDLITTPILYKCIMTLYLFILASIIKIIIPIFLPFDHFLVTSIIGWMKFLFFFLWFLDLNSNYNSNSIFLVTDHSLSK